MAPVNPGNSLESLWLRSPVRGYPQKQLFNGASTNFFGRRNEGSNLNRHRHPLIRPRHMHPLICPLSSNQSESVSVNERSNSFWRIYRQRKRSAEEEVLLNPKMSSDAVHSLACSA